MMELILREDVKSLGKAGELVRVKRLAFERDRAQRVRPEHVAGLADERVAP